MSRWLNSSAVGAAVLLLAAGFCSGDQSGNGLARHKRIFVVPSPGKVKVDGKLGDWDLSGQIEMYVLRATAEMQSAKFAMMYDADALYVSAEIRDPTPLMNRHDPLVDPHMAWDADVCQLRFMLDPKAGYPYANQSGPNDQLVTMNLWYYTDRKEPCLWIGSGGDLVQPAGRPQWPKGVAPRDVYEATYVAAPDNAGYTFEYRIPWRALGAKTAPKAGDILACNVQFDWSSPDGMHTGGGSSWAYDVMSGAGFVFQSSMCWGKAIFADKGNLPRDMVEEGVIPDPPLPLKFAYELPRDAEVTIALVDASGEYVRHVVAQGQRRKGKVVERWDGLDDVGKPLPAGKYTWRGIYHDPITTRHVLSVHNSGKPPFLTTDGTGAWGGDHANPTTVCAAGDRMLLAWGGAEAGWGLLRTDLTGRRQWGIRTGGAYLATDGERIYMSGGEPAGVYSFADGRTLNYGRGEPQIEIPPGDTNANNAISGLALDKGTLFVSFAGRNMVTLYDARQGTIKETWNVPAPGALAIRADGGLLAISQGKVVAVKKDSVVPIAGDHLAEPVSLTLDGAGNIYVANRGAQQNVSVFSADGQYLRAVGKAGGRPRVGLYDKAGMLEPGGIAVDKEGKLWVAETLDYPKRISVWKADDGALLNEFFGAGEYATFASMDPKHEDEVICHNVIWKVDLDKGTWYPQSTIYRQTQPNAAFEPHGTCGCGFPLWIFTAKNGRQYVLAWSANYTFWLFVREGDTIKPLAGAVNVLKGNPFIYWPPAPLFADSTKFPNGTFAWQDTNNDQVMQENELVHYEGRGEQVFTWMDADLNLYSSAGHVFRPIKVEADGRPVYDFTKPEKLPAGVAGLNVTVDPGDGSFFVLDPAAGFSHWTHDGKRLWCYRKVDEWHSSLNRPVPVPGEVWGVTRDLGVAGDFTGIATYQGPFNIFTRDGLFVAKCFKDGRLGDTGPEVINAEAFSGQLVKLEKSGRFLFLGGDTDGRVTEIIGLGTIQRFDGAYELKEEEVKLARQERDKFAELAAKSQPLVIARGRNALAVAVPVRKALDDKRGFTARAAYDEENLYVAFDVDSPAELVSSQADFKTLFKGGNCLDIQIGADASADPKRKTPAPGDVRVLITRQGDSAAAGAVKPLAVIYRPKVRDFKGQPIIFTTPGGGSESFDQIEASDAVKLLDYRRTPSGFSATAAIPLKVLGWMPKPASSVRIDIGYLFGNVTGNQCAVRGYWANNSFTANVVNDVPNESRIEPAEWGSATVE